MAAAGGSHGAHVGLKTVARRGRVTVVAHRHGQEMVLQVGLLNTRFAADETTRFKMVGGPQAGLKQQPLQANFGLDQGVDRRVQRDGFFAGVLHIGFEVVLEVLAHAFARGHHGDVQRREQRGVAHAGELQQLGGVDGAATQNHLTRGAHLHANPVVHHLNTDRTRRVRAFKQHAGGQGAGAQEQVGALHGGAQVGHRGAPAPPLVNRHVHRAKAFLAVTVHVLGSGIAGLLTGLDEGFVERVLASPGAHVQRAAVAAVVVAPFGPCFGLAKVRQAIRVAPIVQAMAMGPALVIQGVSADVDHAVDRGGAADHLATRAVDAPVVHEGLGLGLVQPSVARVGHGVGKTRWHVDEQVVVHRARFQHEHAHVGVLAQAVGQHAAGRAGTHDDVVVCWIAHVSSALSMLQR